MAALPDEVSTVESLTSQLLLSQLSSAVLSSCGCVSDQHVDFAAGAAGTGGSMGAAVFAGSTANLGRCVEIFGQSRAGYEAAR